MTSKVWYTGGSQICASVRVLRLELTLDPSAKVCKSIFLLKTVEFVAKYESVCRCEWLDGDLKGGAVFCGFSKTPSTSSEIALALSCSIDNERKLRLEILEILGKGFLISDISRKG
jgi:hypothetical protein